MEMRTWEPERGVLPEAEALAAVDGGCARRTATRAL